MVAIVGAPVLHKWFCFKHQAQAPLQRPSMTPLLQDPFEAGQASLIAQSVQKVPAVYKMDFGVPEAIWVIEVKDFPAVVTMDANGNSLHADVEERSQEVLEKLLNA